MIIRSWEGVLVSLAKCFCLVEQLVLREVLDEFAFISVFCTVNSFQDFVTFHCINKKCVCVPRKKGKLGLHHV